MKLIGLSAAAAVSVAFASAVCAQPAPSPAALDAARHLLTTMRADQAFERMMSRIQEPVLERMRQTLPPEDVKTGEMLENAIAEEERTLAPKLFESEVTIYATVYTQQELQEIDRFYASPAGQALIDNQAQVSARFLPIVMAESPALADRIVDRFCAQAGCGDEERTALAKARGSKRKNKGG